MNEISQYLITSLLHLLFIPILYAETHYRFKYFFSYLKTKEPEIIADIPSRITHSHLIPILIIIKDADQFPVSLTEVSVIENQQALFSKKVNKDIDVPYFDLIIECPSIDLPPGQHNFSIKINYKSRGTIKSCIVDNHRGTKHKPLPIYISKDPLPRFGRCIYGETHAHTNYTSDQVEFGASLNATKRMSKAIGLDFFCATDHSYDLDDYIDDYLHNDPQLRKWKNFLQEVKESNLKNKDILVVPGEEVTVRNKKGRNVHLLIYNSRKFYPGAGDSGEKWFHNKSELSISQVISDLPDSTLAVSAHPSETPPLLQKLLINRGSWQSEDCSQPGLHGLQFINGGDNRFLNNGKELWIEQLLSGNRPTGLAGNDAHGNFSRFRQVGFPFFTMRENYYHLFGKWRTGVYLTEGKREIDSILTAIRSGNCFMTNGPALFFEMRNNNNTYAMGATCPVPLKGKIKIRTSDEFGRINTVKFILGDLALKSESIIYQESDEISAENYLKEITFEDLPENGYIRVELATTEKYQAFSNPIWFDH